MTHDSTLYLVGGFSIDGRPQATDLAGVARARDIELDNRRDRLTFARPRVDDGGEVRDVVHPDAHAFQAFLCLADAPATEILTIARRWGVLSICRHFVPSSHAKLCGPMPVDKTRERYWEPLSVWRYLSREARLALLVAEAVQSNSDQVRKLSGELFHVHDGRPVLRRRVFHLVSDEAGPIDLVEADWAFRQGVSLGLDGFKEVLNDEEKQGLLIKSFSDHFGVSLSSAERKLRELLGYLPRLLRDYLEVLSWSESERSRRERQGAANVLAGTVNRWLAWGFVRPTFSWKNGSALIRMESGGWAAEALLGALAVQLLIAVNGSGGLALCCGCGGPYLPSRRPAEGRRHYCSACRIEVAQRDAARAYRARRRLSRAKKVCVTP